MKLKMNRYTRIGQMLFLALIQALYCYFKYFNKFSVLIMERTCSDNEIRKITCISRSSFAISCNTCKAMKKKTQTIVARSSKASATTAEESNARAVRTGSSRVRADCPPAAFGPEAGTPPSELTARVESRGRRSSARTFPSAQPTSSSAPENGRARQSVANIVNV